MQWHWRVADSDKHPSGSTDAQDYSTGEKKGSEHMLTDPFD